MKIKTTTGKTIDTNTLSDKEADVSEAMQNLYEVCNRYNITLVAKAVLTDTKYIGAQNQMTGPKSQESMVFLFNLINDFCINTSDGQIRLVRGGNDEINEDNPWE